MIDLRGAVVAGPNEEDGYYRIHQNGFVHPGWLEQLPGVMPPSGDRKLWSVPANMLPARKPPHREVDVPSGLIPRQYQSEAIDFALAARRGALVSLDVGLGKQNPVDTKIATPRGWREIGELRVGDYVFGSDGRPTLVQGVYPQGVKPSYRVTFSDDSSVEAGPDHLWTVSWRLNGSPPYKWYTTELTTTQLRKREVFEYPLGAGVASAGKNLARVPLFFPMLSGPLDYSPKLLPIPPYTMGQLIANGSLGEKQTTPCVVTGERDWPEVEGHIRYEDVKFGCIYRNKQSHAVHTHLVGISQTLRELQLRCKSVEKHIPRNYLETSTAARVALLHGLMDADGSISKKQNRVVYHTISPQLAADIQELVEGLGGNASRRCYDRSSEGKPLEFQVRIRLPEGIAPFRLRRKRERYKPGCHAHVRRTLKSVEYVRDVESVCISVAAADGLYVTEHAILTHNTIVALAAAKALPRARPILVIGPLLTSRIWVGEHSDALKHFGWSFFALRTTKPGVRGELQQAPGYFCNHEILADWQLFLEGIIKPKIVIIDESDILRSPKRLDSKVARRLARAPWVQRVLLLTATPVVNRLSDLWAQLDAIEPGQWGTKNEFLLRFCGGTPSEYFDGYEETGETNVQELQDRLATVMFRRSRFEVRQELPPFERQVVRLPLDDLDGKAHKRYLAAKRDIVHMILQQGGRLRGVSLQQGNQMHAALSLAKVPAAVRIADELARQLGAVVVFCWYQEAARAIAKQLKRAKEHDVFGPITSNTAHKKRDEAALKFRSAAAAAVAESEENRRNSTSAAAASAGAVFVATLGTSGMAINELSAAPVALFSDIYWVPRTLLQAEGRIHREGQRAERCFAKYLLVEGTIDEVMFRHLEHKSEVISKVSADASGLSLCEALGGESKLTKEAAFADMLRGLMSAEELEH